MSEEYRQSVPVTDEVDLSELGYTAGSSVTVLLNPTKALRRAWDATFDLAPEEGESLAEFGARRDAARFPLIPYLALEVRLGETPRVLKTEDDARWLDGLDERILNLAITELWERSAAGVVHARATFRASRNALQPGNAKHPASAAEIPNDSSNDVAATAPGD